jgi:hypothetical protein
MLRYGIGRGFAAWANSILVGRELMYGLKPGPFKATKGKRRSPSEKLMQFPFDFAQGRPSTPVAAAYSSLKAEVHSFTTDFVTIQANFSPKSTPSRPTFPGLQVRSAGYGTQLFTTLRAN